MSNVPVRSLEAITVEIKMLEQSMKKSMVEHAWEIGKRLAEVKEGVDHGNFGRWIEENFEFSLRYAQQFMQFYKQHPNAKLVSYLPSWKHAIEMLSIPDSVDRQDFIQQEHTIPSTGEVKRIDEMTIRELREVKKARKEAEHAREAAEKQVAFLHKELQKEKAKQPNIVEKEIIPKKVEDQLEKLQADIKWYEEKLKLVESQKSKMEEYMKLQEKDAEEYRKLKDKIRFLESQKDDMHRQIESATALSGLVVEIEHLLQNKLAPMKYSRAFEVLNSPVAERNISDIVEMVEGWCREIRSLLGKKEYIEAEVIA